MSYVINALFRGPVEAEAALQELAMAELPKSEYKVNVREPVLNEDLRSEQPDGRKGMLIGLIAGASAGAIFGIILSELRVLPLPTASALLFGIFLGLICGALGGGLYGNGLGHEKLEQLARRFRRGQTLVTAETESQPNRILIEQIFRHHGAIAMPN